MKTSILFALFATAVFAIPTPDDVAPEITTDLDLLQDEAHAEALDLMRKQGSNACKDLADATEDEVKENIKTEQALLDKVNKGENCENEGQQEVKDAHKQRDQAQQKSDDAEDAYKKAMKNKINFGDFEYEQLTPGQCGSFFSSQVYKDAKTKADAAKTAKTKAKGALDQAKKAVEAAEQKAAEKANKCACDVRKLHKTKLADANTKVQSANINAWTKAAHLKCVIDGTSASKCTVPPLPKVQAVSVADNVKNAKCETGVQLALTNYGHMTKFGNKGGWYKSSGSGSWNAEVATSSATIGKNEGIQFYWSNHANAHSNFMMGLDVSNSNRNYNDIDHAIQAYCHGNSCQIQVYERGNHRGSCSHSASNANAFEKVKLQVRRCSNGDVQYFVDNKHCRKSSASGWSSGHSKVQVGSSFHTQGGAVDDPRSIKFSDCMTATPTLM